MAEIIVEAHGARETWTINGEAKRNALSRAMVSELAHHVARVSADRVVRAVVLRGAGTKAFCAGADLEERATMSPEEVTAFLQLMRKTFRALEGSASVAMLFDHLDTMLLATNTGSLFQVTAPTTLMFASERFILQRVIEEKGLSSRLGDVHVEQIRPGHAVAVELDGLEKKTFSLSGESSEGPIAPNGHTVEIVDHSSRTDRLNRCTKCILPETYPFMDFDAQGVCRYCRNWKTIRPKGEKALFDAVRGLHAVTLAAKRAVVEYEADSELRDTEQIPLLEDGGIEAFLRREVLPHAPDAWYVPDSVKTGYEISFTRYFYKPQPLRTLEEIRADILALEKEPEGWLGEIIGCKS